MSVMFRPAAPHRRRVPARLALLWLGLSPLCTPSALAVPDALDRLATRFSIEIAVEDPPQASWPEVSFVEIGPQERQSEPYLAYRELLAEELGKYPPGLIRLAKLQRVSLVRQLAYAGQRRAALPDFVQEILYLDILRGHVPSKGVKLEGFRGKQAPGRLYQRHVVHHEFFHLLAEQLDGSPYAPDPAWSALNPPGFVYGSGGAAAQKGIQYALVHPASGFINRYAMSGLEEDKCEIFAALMLPEESARIARWAETDPYLRAKLEAMKAFLATRVPELDAPFWQHLSPAAVPDEASGSTGA